MMTASVKAMTLGLLAALMVLCGCATIRQEEASDTERLLAAAGFQKRPAETPEQLAQLAAMPAQKLVARIEDGQRLYTYADPVNCRCLYVGGPEEYWAYQRRALQQEVATELDSASLNWMLWAPW